MPMEDREPVLADVDAVHRAQVVVDAYGLSAADRARVVPTARNVAVRSWHLMHARSEQLGGGWRRMWQAGVGDRILRRQAWLDNHAQQLHDAVQASP